MPTDPLTLARVEERTEEKKEAWKNRWLSTRGGNTHCVQCGQRGKIEAGTEYASHCKTYPSKEAAIASADRQQEMAKLWSVRYLGPIRVEVT